MGKDERPQKSYDETDSETHQYDREQKIQEIVGLYVNLTKGCSDGYVTVKIENNPKHNQGCQQDKPDPYQHPELHFFLDGEIEKP
jgi:hypothetical protein